MTAGQVFARVIFWGIPVLLVVCFLTTPTKPKK